jgi:hypothetical protein
MRGVAGTSQSPIAFIYGETFIEARTVLRKCQNALNVSREALGVPHLIIIHSRNARLPLDTFFSFGV